MSQLAQQAVGTATTPAAQAQALVNWFRSGQFRYTLDPPATSGPNPLVQFLTVTKAGDCQQFAGAYGVLARTLGIPTRLAVGFTPGRAGPGDTFTVTGADAHVWPQVYLGPAGRVGVGRAHPGHPGCRRRARGRRCRPGQADADHHRARPAHDRARAPQPPRHVAIVTAGRRGGSRSPWWGACWCSPPW